MFPCGNVRIDLLEAIAKELCDTLDQDAGKTTTGVQSQANLFLKTSKTETPL